MIRAEHRQQFLILDMGEKAMVGVLIDDGHHLFLQKAEIDHHVGLLALILQMFSDATRLDQIAMAMQMPAFRAMRHHAMAGIDADLTRNGVVIHQGIPTILWVCSPSRHCGWLRQYCVAARIFSANAGPSIGCSTKWSKERSLNCSGGASVCG